MQAVEDEIEKLDRLILASEDWAKSYQKNPDIHAKLIKSEAKLMRKLRAYFKALAKERINNYINWQMYKQEAVKAYNFNVTVDISEIDAQESDELLQVVHDPLQSTLALGAASAEETYSLDLGLSQYHSAVMSATSDYVGNLVKDISSTTKDRIQQSIAQSIKLHETQDEAYARLSDILGDPRRAEMIARTETVRAYNKGITVFGEQSGATSKVWEVSSDPCPECEGNDVGEIDFSDSFPSGDDEPPAHPNCRCGMSLIKTFADGSTEEDTTDSGE